MGLRLRAGLLVAASWLVLSVGACDDLPEIQPGVCGNALAEEDVGEACDAFTDAANACGQPGTPFACQYVHDATHTCPAGYGAGLDGLCRQASGVFGATIARIPARGSLSSVADFDGDGRVDLLTSAPFAPEATVSYFGPDALPLASRTLSTGFGLSPVAVGELSADASADVVVPDLSGLFVWRGRADQTFEPKPYTPVSFPNDALPLAAPATALVGPTPELYGQHVPAALVASGADLKIRAYFNAATELAVIPDAGMGDVVGTALVDVDPPFPFTAGSEEIAIALRQGDVDRLVVVTPSTNDIDFRKFESTNFGLGRRLVGGPFRVGAKVGVVTGGADHRFLRLFRLEGGVLMFEDAQLDEPTDSLELLSPLAMTEFSFLPIVLTPFDARVRTACDIVTGSCFARVAVNFTLAPWTTGAMDPKGATIVVGSDQQTGVDVFHYVFGSNLLNPTRLSTDAPVRNIVGGDFDGDGIGDFLLTTRSVPHGCDDDTTLLVAWGSPTGYPEEPVPIGELPALERATVGTLYRPEKVDAIADFGVVTECDGSKAAGVFIGSAGRDLQSPFPLSTELPDIGPLSNQGAAPVCVADIGSHDGPADGHADIIALVSAGEAFSVRALWAAGDAEIGADAAMSPLFSEPDPLARGSLSGLGRLIALDVDLDGDHDVVVIAPRLVDFDANTSLATFVLEVWVGKNEGGQLVFPDTPTAAAAAGFITLDARVEDAALIEGTAQYFSSLSYVEVVRAQLNDDDLPDLAILVRSPDFGELESLSHPYAFLNDGDGAMHELALPFSEGLSALVALDGTPSGTLAFATADDISVCSPSAGGAQELTCSALGLEPGVARIIGLSAGDFDADGVVDLAVSREDGTEVMRQLTYQDGVSVAL